MKRITRALGSLALPLAALGCGEAPALEGDVVGEDEELYPDEGSGDVAGAELSSHNTEHATVGDTIVNGGLAVLVPALGETVTALAELEDGTWESLAIEHSASGIRVIAAESEDAEPVTRGQASSSSPAACNDRAFSKMGYRWNKPFIWRFRSGTTPQTNAKSRVEQSLKEAVANVARSRNNCGLTATSVQPETYLGRTKLSTNIISDTRRYKCGQSDGRNVIGFGVLPVGVVGVACTWSLGHEAIESDVKLNDRGYRWFANNRVPKGCTRAFSVEGVATHEIGHVFGLGHVSEAKHGNLTMSTQTRPCTVGDATLGRGDVLGLRALYGGT